MTQAVGHNSERDQWVEQQFLKGFRRIKERESEMADTKGDLEAEYKRLESFGFNKADIKWAKELEKEDAPKIIASMRRKILIAEYFGHGVSRQFEMFDTDRTPLEDRAYQEGYAAGKLRADAGNPYGFDGAAGQAWQRGMNDGTAFIDKDLASLFEQDDVALISGGDVFEEVEGDEDELEPAE